MQKRPNVKIATSLCLFGFLISMAAIPMPASSTDNPSEKVYNGSYSGPCLNRIAFPIGGIGAGMVCLEGTGTISHVSVRNEMDFFHEPLVFAALCVRGEKNVARVLEGPIPDWKIFGPPETGMGAHGKNYGLPRFEEASFRAFFPFGIVKLKDRKIPLDIKITGWSPFIPGDADNSSLPAGALEYSFKNNTEDCVEAVFSYHAANFMAVSQEGRGIKSIRNGFVLRQEGSDEKPEDEGSFAFFVDDENAVIDSCWFKAQYLNALIPIWRNIREGILPDNPPAEGHSSGASLFVPIKLDPGEERIIKLMFAWYVPETDIRTGKFPENTPEKEYPGYVPWYAGRFSDVYGVSDYWRDQYEDLRLKTQLFSDTFYDTSLPGEVIEAAAANLTILKSPTCLRQADGRLWGYEGCADHSGSWPGSCTHVWNYAQSIPHLFPGLERSLRETEFHENQNDDGRQACRAYLPIRPVIHPAHAAADGQLGGIMKAYREWRISGDTAWLKSLWPRVKSSLDYCIRTWDPRSRGVLEEPHFNTYDIAWWGPNGHTTSFYLGALMAAVKMADALHENAENYRKLLEKGREFLEKELWNGEYFFQRIQTEGLDSSFVPLDYSSNGLAYRDLIDRLNTEGPIYQYGNGCLSDGVLGFWIAHMCGLGEIADPEKVKGHLKSIFRYNLKHDLTDHVNPQRPGFALDGEAGLLLCTWPRGGDLTLPFMYSSEVWTGIEYQVASHLIMEGMVEEGLEIVRACRDRYNGRIRNPFNEYEAGHWYARAMSSFGLLQALTGVRYDAFEKTLYFDSKVGDDFRSFLSTASGFGTVGLKDGEPFVNVRMGEIEIEHVNVSGKESAFSRRDDGCSLN
jgi:uncharacterized protein (DUF608 family)